MRPVLRRIAIHGGLTAIMLGIVGFMLAELASMWLTASPGARTATGGEVTSTDANGETTAALRSHMPLFMAVWGFVFVALGEVTLHLWRSRKPVPPPPPPQQQADETERLLLELLAQAEAARQATGDKNQESQGTEQKAETMPAAPTNGSPTPTAS